MSDSMPQVATGPEAAPESPAMSAPAAESATGAVPDFAMLRDTLPDELRASPTLASYTSFEALARSHVAAQRMVGKRIEDATPDELGRYYARHGRPERPDGYEFPTEADSGSGGSPELERAARDWFHEAGLSQRQAEILYERWNTFAGDRMQDETLARDAQHKAAERELRGEWGRTYERRVASAVRAVTAFGGADLAAWLDETGLGNDPRLVRAFAKIAEAMAEDSLVGDGTGDFLLAPEAARSEITRALRDPAYFDPGHPGHQASVDRMRALFAAAYPEMPADEPAQVD